MESKTYTQKEVDEMLDRQAALTTAQVLNKYRIDETKLTNRGSRNYIVKVTKIGEWISVTQYDPVNESIWITTMTQDELQTALEDTIERMNIATALYNDFLHGKRESVKFWEYDTK